jgi:hypothetical protein
MLVAVPSRGRPGKTPTLGILPEASLYVPAREEGSYRRAGARTVVPVPDTVRGITATRNWILESTIEERVVFIDDVKTAGWIRLYAFRAQHRTLPAAAWMRQFERAFDLCEELGYKLWGVATHSAPRGVYPFHPILFRTYVTASCMGMFRSSDRFDEAFPVKEDYELCLRAIERDGGVLGIRYLYWENQHWDTAGGCRDYRTQEMEEQVTKALMERYPRFIRRVERGGSRYSVELEF